VSASTELPHRLVVLVSGGGTNLQSILDAIEAGELNARVTAVVSNNPAAGGLERARQRGIPALVVNHRDYRSRDAYDRALLGVVEPCRPDLVVLAGFMRILGPAFVERFDGRIMNIHPSLLPLYPGLDTHARAIRDGRSEHGATVHFVNTELDGGPIIAQARVPVLAADTPERLAARVLCEEHILYPRVIRWFVDRRLRLEGNRVLLDGALRPEQGLQTRAAETRTP